MTTGERIRLLRMEKGLSQEGLADALDVTRQAVSRWETDGSLPDIDKLIGLCDLFGVSLDYLVRGKEPVCEAAQNKAESPDPSTPHYSIPISRTAIAGILCIVLGVSAAPLLIFWFTPFVTVRYILLALVPVILLAAGVLLLLKRKPSGIWYGWGLLLTGALIYTYRIADDLQYMIRGMFAAYPELLYREWPSYRQQIQAWPIIGILITGMMLWTILRYRKTGLPNRDLRRLLFSAVLFFIAAALSGLIIFQVTRMTTGVVVYLAHLLYGTFWIAILALTYCLVWLFSPCRSAPSSAEP